MIFILIKSLPLFIGTSLGFLSCLEIRIDDSSWHCLHFSATFLQTSSILALAQVSANLQLEFKHRY
jgi:hypothetical protein